MYPEPEPHAPVRAIVVCTHRMSAWVFFGLATLIAVDIALVGTFNPDNKEIAFWIMLTVMFGGMLLWTTWIGCRLRRGAGVIAAYTFLGCISGLVLIGALIQIAGGYPETTPFRGMKVLAVARLFSGLYILLAWVVLIWESVTNRKRGGGNTRKH